MSGIYGGLAAVYDRLNADIDYKKWAGFIDRAAKKYSRRKGKLALDLGCGTGSMTLALAGIGYDMTGVDISPDMLTVARDRAEAAGANDILWLCQDMREFELYGSVDLAVCCLDGINHLTGDGDIEKCFALVHNYLDEGGLFIFDVNSPYKFKNVYSDNAYILEDEGILCAWQNCYDKSSGLCDFVISAFFENEDGSYHRTDGEQTERCYTRQKLRRALSAAGFETVGVFGDFDFSAPDADAERLYFITRKNRL